MTPSFQERSELKDDGGTNPDEGRIGKENSVTPSFQERSELKDDGGTNPDEGRIGKENSVTPSFQERSACPAKGFGELKDDGGFSETQDLKSADGGDSNVDSRTNSDPSETPVRTDVHQGGNPDEVRIGKGKGNNRRNVVYQVSIS